MISRRVPPLPLAGAKTASTNDEIRTGLIDKYNNNGLSWDDIRKKPYFDDKGNIVKLDSVSAIDRFTGEVKSGIQSRININEGYERGFYNAGCPVVLKQDYKYLERRFNKKVYKKYEADKIGRLYVFQ